VLKDSEGIRKILEKQERELKNAQEQADTSAATLIAGRKAWIEEFVIQSELLAVAEVEERLASAEKDVAEAEAAGNADAVQSAEERVEAIREVIRTLRERD
jgi:hypothetical protein